MTPKEFLRQGTFLDARIDGKLEEVARLRAKLEGGRMNTITGMPRGGGCADWTDTLARVVELERQIDAEVGRLVDIKRAIRYAIAGVRDDRYRTVLELRYLSGYNWQKIADIMCYDVTWVYKLHGWALKQINCP